MRVNMKNEIILYQMDELSSHLEVKLHDDTVWLNRHQLSTLFNRDIKTIGKHIGNVFNEKELQKNSTVAKFATVQKEGGRIVTRNTEYYNLDVIISVGYRVKSKQGTQFRIWANKILRDYLLKGYSFNRRLNHIENNIDLLSNRVNDIEFQIKSDELPNQGVFFNGQIYDAYEFINKIIKQAKQSIILIDNYIDDTVITQLTNKRKNVKVYLLSKNISRKMLLDIEKANQQYPEFNGVEFKDAHDRFLIIDNKTVYHIGASLKDLGKKWFAFSRMNKVSLSIINSIQGYLIE